jgi:hypothetical protein
LSSSLRFIGEQGLPLLARRRLDRGAAVAQAASLLAVGRARLIVLEAVAPDQPEVRQHVVQATRGEIPTV